MKQTRMKSMLSPLLLLAVLCLPACNNDDEGLLPDGKYPLTLTASIDKLTLTRADGKSAWAIDDPIAVSVDGGTSHKIYKITNASTGAMEANNPKDPCYWIQNKDQRILAWYPANVASETDISDQSAGFAAFDYLTSDGTYNRTSANVALPFKHQMAKVKYTLEAGEGITNDDLSSVTVQIYGFTKASFTKGELSGNTNGWITPYATDREALLVPQQMQSMDFIKVTVDGNDFYYTPTGENDANLESGKQYTYKITVKKTGLEVSVDTPVSWKEGAATSGAVAEATSFNVTCPGNGNGVENFEIVGVNTPPSGDKYTVNANTTTISYTTDLKRSRYNLVQGIAKVSTPINENGTIKFTVSDIRGDLVFSFDEYAEVGDYYYADGTWSPDYVPGGSPACIGIVFKVGAAAGDAASNYGNKLPKGIRGYVVALTDATQDICEWGERDINTPLENVTSANNADYNGFKNTETIIKVYRNTNKWHYYDAFQAIIDYRSAVVAPQSSSDWYLPSLKQLADIYSLYQNNPNYILYGRLQKISSDNLFREAPEMTIHPGTKGRGGYWTSTEMKNSDAWFIRFTDGSREAFGKGQDWHKDSYVRAILTF